MPPLISSNLVSSLSNMPTTSRTTLNNLNTSITMSTTSQRHHHHHHHTNSRSQTLLKLSNMIPPSSTNLQINLIEPVLYFRGDTEESVGCFLRGDLILNLSKPTKIRKIEMKFVGKMKTFWPEGKLYYGSNANRNDLCEEQEIMTHNWTFVAPPTPSSEISSPSSPLSSGPSSHRLRVLRTRSFASSSTSTSSSSSSKFHIISAGVHKYPFELFIPGNIPETIEAERGTVTYKLSATAIRSGLSPNLHASQNVTIIRTVLEERNSEGIAIASDYNNQLGYEITIPKKAYPIGDSIDLDLKLSPRTKKVKITGVKIQIDEKSVYKANSQRNIESRTLSINKFDNFTEQSTRSGKNYNDNIITTQEGNPSSANVHEYENENNLENLFYHENISFPIPKCTSPIHYSYKSSSINISHYLKFTFTIKLPLTDSDNNDDGKKKKKVEMTVDVPITILSCSCADDLPQYEDESYNYHDNSPSYESPPSYEQSTNNRRRSQIYNSINNSINNSTDTITAITTITTDLQRPPPL